MTQPDQTTPYIPGLITPTGAVQPPVTTPAQPGAQFPAGAVLPPGTVTAGVLPAPQFAVTPQSAPALPQAGSPSVLPPVPQVDPAVLQAYLAQQQAAAQQAPTPQPQPVFQPQPQLPTNLPGLTAPPASIPGLAAPAPAAPTAVTPSAAPPATGEPNGLDDGNGESYPNAKPLSEQTDAERADYYKWYSRRWEARAKARQDYDALKAKAAQFDQMATQNMTEVEQRVAAARSEGYAQAAAAAATVLVDAHVRAGLQSRLQPHQIESLATKLDHKHFLAQDGQSVDAAKVSAFINEVAPVSVPADPATAVPAATAPAAPAVPGALPTGVPIPGQPATGLPRPDLGQGQQAQTPLDKLAQGKATAQQFLAGNL